MKAVMISIKPEWCAKIASGEKTVEVRKTKPKIDVPFKCYIYCTKAPKGWFDFGKKARLDGKVIGEFVCDRIYQYACDLFRKTPLEGVDISTEEMVRLSCLTVNQLYKYEHSSEPKENCINLIGVYGWHISNLVIYDKPKQIEEFTPHCKYMDEGRVVCDHLKTACPFQEFQCSKWPKVALLGVKCRRHLKRPPQSWCYVEELNGQG